MRFGKVAVVVISLSITAAASAQDARLKDVEPIVPPGEKMTIAEAEGKGFEWGGNVKTPRGNRIQFTLNGKTYQVTEVAIKQTQCFQVFALSPVEGVPVIPYQVPFKKANK